MLEKLSELPIPVTVQLTPTFTLVNIFAFLAATLFDYAGISDKKSLWLYFGFGMANFL